MALRLITLLRPSVQSLAVAHVITSELHPDVNPTGAVHTSFDSQRQVIPGGCRTGMECPTTTSLERAFFSCRELKTFLFRSSFPDVI